MEESVNDESFPTRGNMHTQAAKHHRPSNGQTSPADVHIVGATSFETPPSRWACTTALHWPMAGKKSPQTVLRALADAFPTITDYRAIMGRAQINQ
ncbi:hypothetical protein AVEN_62483-1 [Araneus ventricosus]|uniref:Uncharacterized protein n=1 Tax=Araneus ventricosus TaxID=182803 RepID=A0A4Y2JYS2_ARAVE|nr:hypothetical protein AVEN_62483-1 [Araneus ventricosus]